MVGRYSRFSSETVKKLRWQGQYSHLPSLVRKTSKESLQAIRPAVRSATRPADALRLMSLAIGHRVPTFRLLAASDRSTSIGIPNTQMPSEASIGTTGTAGRSARARAANFTPSISGMTVAEIKRSTAVPAKKKLERRHRSFAANYGIALSLQ